VLPDGSGGCLGGNRFDPSHDVRFLQQTLRLQELADLHHGAMKTAHAVTLPQVREGQITACGLQWCFRREKRVTPVIRIPGNFSQCAPATKADKVSSQRRAEMRAPVEPHAEDGDATFAWCTAGCQGRCQAAILLRKIKFTGF
jgi:hypothetical protein